MVLLAPAYLWLAVAVFLPLSAMGWFSLLPDMPGEGGAARLTLANYAAFLADPTYPTLLWKSLKLAATVTGVCLLLGFPAALALARAVPGRTREALLLLVILPFWSNSLVRVFSWAVVLRGNGLLERALDAVLPWDAHLGLMFTWTAVVIGLVHSYLPYVILTAYLALQGIEEEVVEAARALGAGRWTVLRRVLLPLCLPGLAAGAALVFVPVAGSFMEPRILGGRFGATFGTVIEDQFTAVYNWPFGAALSFILLAVTLAVLAAAAPALRRAA